MRCRLSSGTLRFFVLLCCLVFVSTNLYAQEEETKLILRSPITREIKSGEKHTYQIKANAGEFLHVLIRQRGVNLFTMLFDSSGKEILKADSPFSRSETEWLSWKAETGSVYKIEVRGVANVTFGKSGKYEIEVAEKRLFTQSDQQRVVAQDVFIKGMKSFDEKKYAQAIDFFQSSLTQYQQANRKSEAALCMSSIGRGFQIQNRFQEAIDWYSKALNVYRELQDEHGEMVMHNQLGICYNSVREAAKFYEELKRTLSLSQKLGDKTAAIEAMLRLGYGYIGVSRYDEANPLLEQTATFANELKEYSYEGYALNGLAIIYNFTGRYDKSAESYEKAITAFQKMNDRRGIATILLNLSGVYKAWGKFGTAIRKLEEALKIADELIVVNEPSMGTLKVGILGATGSTYYEIGHYEKALEYLQKSLALAREIKAIEEEYSVLRMVGNVYLALEKFEEARKYLEESHAVYKKLEEADPGDEADILRGLSEVYRNLKIYEKAFDTDQKGLFLCHKFQDRKCEGLSLNGLGLNSVELQKYDEAISYFEKALNISRETDTKELEGSTLTNLMMVYKLKKENNLAIFFGKQAVNSFQEIRADVVSLEKRLRLSYLQKHEEAYRNLAETLIEEERLPEAEQVLALLKTEEFSQLIKRNAVVRYDVNYTKTEKEAVGFALSFTALSKELIKLNDKLKDKSQSEKAAVEKQIAYIQKQKTEIDNNYKKSLTSISQTQTTDIDIAVRAQGLIVDQKSLTKDTAVLYTLVSKGKGAFILITQDGQKSFPIDAAELPQTVSQFRESLRSPKTDPLPHAQKLYQKLMTQKNDKGETLAASLEKQGAKTLLWSLDGVLRYVPINALHDGRKYLIESYANAVFTPASLAHQQNKISNQIKHNAVGFGVSKGYDEFPALKNVPQELGAIIRDKRARTKGILSGAIRLDVQFTKKTFLDDMKRGFSIVHISTHFSFQPALEEESFLLLGDGSRFSIAEMKTYQNLFKDVEVLTLAACDTATVGNQSSGKEVEGLVYTAQSLGAKTVLASLLPLSDNSSPDFMKEFYRELTAQRQTTYVKAFRQSALKLLKSPKTKHPFYWASIVLIGTGN